MVTKPKQYHVEVPKGYKPPEFYAKLGRAAMLLDTLTSESRMYGIARRTKRRSKEELDTLYGDINRYVLHWEQQIGVHPQQYERIRRGKNFSMVIACVIMEGR